MNGQAHGPGKQPQALPLHKVELDGPHPIPAPDQPQPVADLHRHIVVNPAAPLADRTVALVAAPPVPKVVKEGLNLTPLPQLVLYRGLCLRRPLVRLCDLPTNLVEEESRGLEACTVKTIDLISDEISMHEALSHPSWRAAIQEEFNSLMFNATWDLIELLPNKKALTSKWVLKAKPMMNPTRLRLKVRLVARGIEHRLGIDNG